MVCPTRLPARRSQAVRNNFWDQEPHCSNWYTWAQWWARFSPISAPTGIPARPSDFGAVRSSICSPDLTARSCWCASHYYWSRCSSGDWTGCRCALCRTCHCWIWRFRLGRGRSSLAAFSWPGRKCACPTLRLGLGSASVCTSGWWTTVGI